MSNLLRQLSYHLARGNVKSAVPAAREWDFEDVNDRLVLIIGEGKITGGSRLVAASGGTFTLPLPSQYDNTQPLVCFISVYGTIRALITRPSTTNGTMLLTGASDREGTGYFTDLIGSILLTNPSVTDAVFVRYLLFEQPDLLSSSSFRGGSVNFGVDTNG